ncbi:hypothetical protein GC096_01615 [Paenibacillus sp. LMG 31461]|uniref:Major facilitator superfamily (MFS) profile domain-containing protein n=1 Tax=Paenibacillus plantarum TaxID=2654975 RepID=A0ABX1X2X0_9BACL|nr:hypothetical protein [Paenibacillus plantarum]NOU62743.1 hypothetical protein [Paenibacillus plantarum]
MTYISFIVPAQVRGYSIGWFIAAADFGTSSGAFLMGWLAESFSFEMMLSIAAGLGGVTIILALSHQGRKKVAH